MRFFSFKAGLVAGMAIFLSAQTARAQFSLQFKDNATGDGFKITNSTAHPNVFTETLFGTGTVSSLSASESSTNGTITVTGLIDGYKFQATGKWADLGNGSLEKSTMSALVTNLGHGAATNFSFYVANSGFAPMNQNPVYLKASIFSNGSGVYNRGDSAQTQGHYQATNNLAVTYLTDTAKVTGINQSSPTNTIEIHNPGKSVISDIGGIATKGLSGSKIQFFSQAVVSAAEPGGVLLGLCALPCMGLVVLMARRFKTSVAVC
jgi:hypothetical protein